MSKAHNNIYVFLAWVHSQYNHYLTSVLGVGPSLGFCNWIMYENEYKLDEEQFG